MSREAAYVALFTRLQTLSGTFKVIDRRLRTLDDMKPPELPALFVSVGPQKVQPNSGVPARRTLTAHALIYVAASDASVASGIQMNNLIDLVEAALAPSNVLAPNQTLGGVVAHAWIEGTIDVFEAVQTQRAACVIPIHMLIP